MISDFFLMVYTGNGSIIPVKNMSELPTDILRVLEAYAEYLAPRLVGCPETFVQIVNGIIKEVILIHRENRDDAAPPPQLLTAMVYEVLCWLYHDLVEVVDEDHEFVEPLGEERAKWAPK